MYLGIDESNHGRTPEFFVGVYSTNESDITNIQSKPKFKKIRKRLSIEDIVKGRKFKYVVFDDKLLNHIHKDFLITIATVELINDERTIDSIIIDGTHHKQEAINSIYESILPNKVNKLQENPKIITSMPEISCISDADRRTKIVNMADGVAYRLFKQYEQIKNFAETKKYDKYRILPDLNKYKKFIGK